LSRRKVIEESLSQYGAIIVVDDGSEAAALINDLAPEHLEIISRDNAAIADCVRHAGAIFFGDQTPEAVGDYFAGPNHVLPTSGAARFSSGLSVSDFLKRTNTISFSAGALRQSATAVSALAHAEGLDAHARSVLIRLEENR